MQLKFLLDNFDRYGKLFDFIIFYMKRNSFIYDLFFFIYSKINSINLF